MVVGIPIFRGLHTTYVIGPDAASGAISSDTPILVDLRGDSSVTRPLRYPELLPSGRVWPIADHVDRERPPFCQDKPILIIYRIPASLRGPPAIGRQNQSAVGEESD